MSTGQRDCVTGPNGKHRRIVSPAAHMSLHDAREASTIGLLQPKVAQSIVAQLVCGVAFLHSNSIVHGGLHLGNNLVRFLEAIDSLSTTELYEKFGEPYSEAVVRVDGQPLQAHMPTKVYIPGWLGVTSNELVLG